METTAKRTLVKSAPELWELADDEARMQGWMATVLGLAEPVAVEITDREPGRILAWRAATESYGRIALELEEKGFGTSVVITAHHQGPDGAAGIALETVLDELGSPARRPFARA